MIDAQTFGAELAGIVKAATAPLIARIDALEKHIAVTVDVPSGITEEALKAGLKATEERFRSFADEAMQKAIEAQQGHEPEVMTVEDIKALIADGVDAAVSALPPAEKGADGRDGVDGKDGASVVLDDVLPALQAQVDKFLADIPAPKDGIDGKDGASGLRGEKGESGADGVGLAGALIDRDGNLVITLTNGEAKSLGVVVGKDGFTGADGKDGTDGLGFEDMEFATDDIGRPVAKFRRGDVVKSVTLPCIIDRGPYRTGEAYQKGDAVSYGGGLWIAQGDTAEKPEGGAGWRLAVKKGRDGRDGALKPVGGK